jgi:hypothetical protein
MYSPRFEAFWSAYPKTTVANSKAEAFKVFERLSPEDQTHAAASLPAFSEFCRNQWASYQPPGVAVFLGKRRFDEFAPTTPTATDTVSIPAGLLIKAEAFYQGEWRPQWGPPPGEPGCTIPEEIISAARSVSSANTRQIRGAA